MWDKGRKVGPFVGSRQIRATSNRVCLSRRMFHSSFVDDIVFAYWEHEVISRY